MLFASWGIMSPQPHLRTWKLECQALRYLFKMKVLLLTEVGLKFANFSYNRTSQEKKNKKQTQGYNLYLTSM